MPDHLDLVNAYVRRMRAWTANALEKSEPDHWSVNADAMQALIDETLRLRAWATPVPTSYGDVSDLPPELLAQLSGVKTDELEDQIYVTVKAAGDQIDLDHLLIELYRRFGDIHQRRFLMNKAYRMSQKGLIHLVTGKKGVYSVVPQSAPAVEDDDDEFSVSFAPESEPPAAPVSAQVKPQESFSADLDDEIPF